MNFDWFYYYRTMDMQLYLCLDGAKAGRAVGSLALQTFESRSAPTVTGVIALSGLRTEDVTVACWSTKHKRKQELEIQKLWFHRSQLNLNALLDFGIIS